MRARTESERNSGNGSTPDGYDRRMVGADHQHDPSDPSFERLSPQEDNDMVTEYEDSEDSAGINQSYSNPDLNKTPRVGGYAPRPPTRPK